MPELRWQEGSKVPYSDRILQGRSGYSFLRFFPEDNGELSFAGLGWVIEGRAFAVRFGSVEEESLLGIFGEPDEACLAIGIGSDLEVELVEAHEPVGDVDTDVGGIDGLAVFLGDNEIRSARTKAGVDFGDGFGVDFGVCGCGLGEGTCWREKQQNAGNREREGISEGG